MKCSSCGTEIPPQWVAAIQSNRCPACNGSIMNDSEKELLEELTIAMTRMPGDPEGVAGWLLSNYKLRKIGAAEPVDHFHGRKKKRPRQEEYDDDGEDEDDGEPEVTEFMKRSGALNKANHAKSLLKKARNSDNPKFRAMAKHIAEIDDDGDEIDGEPDVSSKDFKTYQYYKQLAEGKAAPSFTPSRSYEDFDDDDSNKPSHIEKVLSSSREGSRVLQEIEFKREKARDAFESGTGIVKRA